MNGKQEHPHKHILMKLTTQARVEAVSRALSLGVICACGRGSHPLRGRPRAHAASSSRARLVASAMSRRGLVRTSSAQPLFNRAMPTSST